MSAIVSGKRYGIGRAKLEEKIVATIMDWARDFPAELVAFDQQQRQERSELYRRNGISPTGNFRRVGEIPVRLHNMIARRIGNKDWIMDLRVREMFWSHFKVGLLAEGGRMRREPD